MRFWIFYLPLMVVFSIIFGLIIESNVVINDGYSGISIYLVFIIMLVIYLKSPGRLKRKSARALSSERYDSKKCSWCGRHFTWADSGRRYYCSKQCETSDA
jgi:hypothetical protein